MERTVHHWLDTLLHRGMMAAILGMFLTPALVSAESIDLVRTAQLVTGEPRPAGKSDRPLIGLDENGDVTIKFSKVSLTMSYSPTDLLPSNRERVVLNTSPEPPAVGGFGIKVGFTF